MREVVDAGLSGGGGSVEIFDLREVFCGWVGCGGIEDFARQAIDLEDGFEVAVALDEAGFCVLEAGFGQLGLDEEVAELEVDLGAVFEAAAEGDAGMDSEVGLGGGFDSQQIGYGGRRGCRR